MGYVEIIKHPISGVWSVRHVNRDATELPPSTPWIGIVPLSAGEEPPAEGQVYDGAAFTDAFITRPGPRLIPTREFMMRLKPEFAAIKAARATDVEVDFLWEVLVARETVDLDSPVTTDGLDLLVAKGLLAGGRVSDIRQ